MLGTPNPYPLQSATGKKPKRRSPTWSTAGLTLDLATRLPVGALGFKPVPFALCHLPVKWGFSLTDTHSLGAALSAPPAVVHELPSLSWTVITVAQQRPALLQHYQSDIAQAWLPLCLPSP